MIKEVKYKTGIYSTVPIGTSFTTFRLHNDGTIEKEIIKQYYDGDMETFTKNKIYKVRAIDIKPNIHGIDILFEGNTGYYYKNLDGTGPSGYAGFGH